MQEDFLDEIIRESMRECPEFKTLVMNALAARYEFSQVRIHNAAYGYDFRVEPLPKFSCKRRIEKIQ